MYTYKVKYGFGSSEFVLVKDKEVQKAIYARYTGKPMKLGDAFIDGSKIISITPDYHTYTGWYRSYEPQEADDWKQIERDVPKEIHDYLSESQNIVTTLIAKKEYNLIGKEAPNMEKLPEAMSEDILRLTEKLK